VDINNVVIGLRSFISQYHTQFLRLSRTESQLLEIGALMLGVEHYRRQGFEVNVQNKVGNRFKLKVSAKGKPFNFSWYSASKSDVNVEIHGNLPVGSAYGRDDGVYVVDVGVVEAGTLPTKPKERKLWRRMDNKLVITFIEAKKLVVYPMLMAQFIGMVHEIKPSFMKRRFECAVCHFYPALVSVGYLRGTSANIREGFRKRHFRVNVVPTFDIHVSRLAHDSTAASPFEPIQALQNLPARLGVSTDGPITADDIPF
jgi:hypothetical protein